jgi:hypothetical protein
MTANAIAAARMPLFKQVTLGPFICSVLRDAPKHHSGFNGPVDENTIIFHHLKSYRHNSCFNCGRLVTAKFRKRHIQAGLWQ